MKYETPSAPHYPVTYYESSVLSASKTDCEMTIKVLQSYEFTRRHLPFLGMH